MTGVAFVLYTFYMVTDPATTPEHPWAQVAFGSGVAAMYGVLMASHIVFGLFFALTTVSALRGAVLWAIALAPARDRVRVAAQQPAVAVSRAGLES
jgi:hypothetical protein